MKSTKHLFLVVLALAALSGGVWAQTSDTQTAAGSSPQSSESAATTRSPAADADLRSEVEELKQLIRAQQKRIDALESERQYPAVVNSTDSSAPPPSDQHPASSAPIPSAVNLQTALAGQGQQAGSSDERIRNLERQIKGLGPISFSGDVRLRAEPFFGGPSNESLERVRGRFRTRFNAIADLGSQFQA